MARYASTFEGSEATIAAGSPHAALLDWGRRLNVAVECSCKQLGGRPSEMREAGSRMAAEATHYAQQTFCLMALLTDAP
jgi:hypothetical protein